MNARLCLFWFLAACGCAWYDDDRGHEPCDLHKHMSQARWC